MHCALFHSVGILFDTGVEMRAEQGPKDEGKETPKEIDIRRLAQAEFDFGGEG